MIFCSKFIKTITSNALLAGVASSSFVSVYSTKLHRGVSCNEDKDISSDGSKLEALTKKDVTNGDDENLVEDDGLDNYEDNRRVHKDNRSSYEDTDSVDKVPIVNKREAEISKLKDNKSSSESDLLKSLDFKTVASITSASSSIGILSGLAKKLYYDKKVNQIKPDDPEPHIKDDDKNKDNPDPNEKEKKKDEPVFPPGVSDSGNNSNKKYVHYLTTLFVLSVLLYALYKFRKYYNTKKAFELADQAYADFSNNKNPEKLEKICEYGECFLYYLKNPEKLEISDLISNGNLNKRMSTKYRVYYGKLSVRLKTLLGCPYYYLASFSAKSTYHANYYVKHLKEYFDICNFVSNFIEGSMVEYVVKNIDVAKDEDVTKKTFLEVRNWANRLPYSSFKEDLKKMLKFYPSLVSVIVLAYNNIKDKSNKNNYEKLINNVIKLLLKGNIIKLDNETIKYLKNMFKFETDNKIPEVINNTDNTSLS